MNDKVKKMFTPATIILIGGLITLLLTYVATKIQEKNSQDDQKKLLDKNNEIRNELVRKTEEYAQRVDLYAQTEKSNHEEIKTLQRQLYDEAKEQAKKSDELAKKSDENAKLNEKLRISQEKITQLTEETVAFVTGGDSFCYAELFIHKDLKEVGISLQHKGKYPLQNLSFSIQNTDYACEQLNFPRVTTIPIDIEPYHKTFEVNSLIGGEHKYITQLPTVLRDEKSFNVHFRSNGRQWFQRAVLRESYGGHFYTWATQVYKIDAGKEVILAEGDNITISDPRTANMGSTRFIRINGQHEKIIPNTIWGDFPLHDGETSPWSKRCRIHWQDLGGASTFNNVDEKGIIK